ncbi:putative 5-methyltetrahydropteroyltriglutamate-homocysteine methyltransferase [Rosellinia necatrix]|uniref:Putative 5-methyltetrahydropteroyltriglutamate-homocysteine methyltransferase n=1 Tax=Rosellinia necatrix TaxID=77044 RepID=A0A1W2TP32_ROSNE|nr:putative 5-methyltetrahydropteroyltriglutamate-homocysteine methyltransferase [Rosellinia necatrix]
MSYFIYDNASPPNRPRPRPARHWTIRGSEEEPGADHLRTGTQVGSATMPLPNGVYRADQVGSLLRPRELLAAREEAEQGRITAAQLRALEDKHIADVVRKQRAVGLRSVTDGEFRRRWFHVDFLKHLSGVEQRGALRSTNVSVGGTMPPRLVVVDKIRHPAPIQVDDYRFLESRIAAADDEGDATATATAAVAATAKVCIPSPTMIHFRNSRETIDEAAYPTLDPFFDDLARVYREELDDLYRAGCRFVQLDDTNLAYLCDPGMRAAAEQRHGDADRLARRYAALINAAVAGRPRDLAVGIHLCRGNHRSRWFAQGGYEPVAEVLFRELDVDVYFLEYDDARSGDFSPLRHLPPHKVVVLGLLTSKTAALDDRAQVIGRLREAAAFCPRGLDQLCLSHQCGFSSTSEGNDLSEEDQWAKLRLEVDIATEVWGDDPSL